MTGIWVGAIVLFLISAGLAAFWLSRAVGARRLNAAADAYAEREIARTRGVPLRKAQL